MHHEIDHIISRSGFITLSQAWKRWQKKKKGEKINGNNGGKSIQELPLIKHENHLNKCKIMLNLYLMKFSSASAPRLRLDATNFN